MKEIDVKDLSFNPFMRIKKEWMLVTAGTEEGGYNTMTASWGHLGSVWGNDGGAPTTVIYVRPQRYTKEFVDKNDLYTLCFFDGRKEELMYLGVKSGRDEDKVAKVGFTPAFGDGFTYFEEASLVLVCRKLYSAPILEENFIDKTIAEKIYSQKDFHQMYIGEVVKVLSGE